MESQFIQTVLIPSGLCVSQKPSGQWFALNNRLLFVKNMKNWPLEMADWVCSKWVNLEAYEQFIEGSQIRVSLDSMS